MLTFYLEVYKNEGAKLVSINITINLHTCIDFNNKVMLTTFEYKHFVKWEVILPNCKVTYG